MYRLLTFDITPDRQICVKMIVMAMHWHHGRTDKVVDFFEFLSEDVPVGVTQLNPSTEGSFLEKELELTWFVPISLAEYLVDRFNNTHNVVLCHLKTWLNLHERKSV